MSANLNADHKKHLLFLAEQTPQVLQDFCKLAIDYLQKGPNLKLYVAASQKLQVEPEVIRRSTEGLINLLLESAKHAWSEQDYRSVVNSLGFSEEKEASLLKLRELEKSDVERALTKLGSFSPRYHDVEWRFQIQLARRSLVGCSDPHFTLDLMLKSCDKNEEAEHVLLQCDASNLLRLTRELESALAESQTQRMRNIERNIK